ncbi:MAG: glycosyltransferase family 2 protein [Pseudonocardiaceae bacterium]
MIGADVTIAILCYNQAELIGRTVESALAQSVRPVEILVCDDGSTDDSLEVLSGYADDGVMVLRHGDNRGRTATRNTLLAATNSEILVYLDGDTVARSDLVEQLLPEFGVPEVAAVGGQGVEVYRDTLYDRWRAECASQGWGPERREDIPWLWGLCCSFRTAAAREVGGFFGYGEDVQMGHALRERGYLVRYVPAAMVEHHRQDGWASLGHMLFRWWRSGYIVESRWGMPAFRRLSAEILRDHGRRLVRRLGNRDWRMAGLEIRTAAAKFRGMAEGRRVWRLEASSNGSTE